MYMLEEIIQFNNNYNYNKTNKKFSSHSMDLKVAN